MGENGEEAAAAIQEIQKPLHTAVHNPRRNERHGKSLAGMAGRY